MVEKGLLGEKIRLGLLQEDCRQTRRERARSHSRPSIIETLEYTAQQSKPRFDCIGAVRKQAETLEEKVRDHAHRARTKGSRVRLQTIRRDGGVRRQPHSGDCRRHLQRRSGGEARASRGTVGIFETWDALGVKYAAERMQQDGFELPPIARALLDAGHESFYNVQNGRCMFFDLTSKSYKPVPQSGMTLILGDLKAGEKTVEENAACSLIDLGDGILCAEFHTKMNTIDGDMMTMLQTGVDKVNNGEFEGLVLANQGEHFSAGANLFMVLGYIMQGDFRTVEEAIRGLQGVNMNMRFCRGPVVSAPHHYTFGGGVEMCQHTARVVVAGETYGGLVEFGVGIIPAGGGTKEMLRRALAYVPANVPEGDPFPYVRRAFENIAMAKVGTSGPETIALGYFTDNDVLCINYEHQVQRAKDVCRGLLVAGYTPPKPAKLTALGEPARATFRSGVYQMQLAGYASEHDALVAEKLANTLTGGGRAPGTAMSEQDVLDLECEAMLSLCGTEKTQQRMQHMLQTGKPLRN
jgi:3-hydroxyacyl-CoA dehydrogenase